MRKTYYKIINFFRWFFIFFLKVLLKKHKFYPTDLVIRPGTRVIYEVEINYYTKDLKPVTIVKRYGSSVPLFGIDEYEILEFTEYKKVPNTNIYTKFGTEAIITEEHVNTKFATVAKWKKPLGSE